MTKLRPSPQPSPCQGEGANSPSPFQREGGIMKSFFIQTLGCKVNQYETEQIVTLLRSRGLRQTDSPELADLRIVNSCSVTTEAASKSRQSTRRLTRLPVLNEAADSEAVSNGISDGAHSLRLDDARAHAKRRGR